MSLQQFLFHRQIARTEPTVSNVTPIYTLEDLYDVRNDLSGAYKLMNDLDFNDDSDYENIANKTAWAAGSGWTPIGDGTNKFTGLFDGQGFAIYNLHINRYIASGCGLFGILGDGVDIKNLSVLDASVINTSGGDTTGILFGGTQVASTTGLIENCHTSGVVSGDYYTGGISGDYGAMQTGLTSAMKRCSSSASVNGNWFGGGLVGVSRGVYEECFASGSVNATWYAGGFGGLGDYSWFTNCYAIGPVSGSSSPGGFIAYVNIQHYGTWSSCYWDTQTTGQATSFLNIGDGKTTAQMKQEATFVDWDFGNIWDITEDVTYPFLR